MGKTRTSQAWLVPLAAIALAGCSTPSAPAAEPRCFAGNGTTGPEIPCAFPTTTVSTAPSAYDCEQDKAKLDALQEGRTSRISGDVVIVHSQDRTKGDGYEFRLPTDKVASGTMQLTWTASSTGDPVCHLLTADVESKVWFNSEEDREETVASVTKVLEDHVPCRADTYGECSYTVRMMYFPDGAAYFWASAVHNERFTPQAA